MPDRNGKFFYTSITSLPNTSKSAGFIEQHSGFVLAGIEGYRYQQEELQLSAGDEMFFYTDGVTEATDEQDRLFGTERLLSCLDTCREKEIAEQLDTLKHDIDEFVGNRDQFDDITLMAMRITA